MIYTVGEAAKILNVAPSTIRYYDKEGLLPFVERSNGGIRMFTDESFQWLYIIDCLKKTGMPIKDIKAFIDMAMLGDETIEQRLELFKKQREAVSIQITEMQKMLDILDYKCWYYETAIAAGSTSVPRNMDIDDVPEDLRKTRVYLNTVHNAG